MSPELLLLTTACAPGPGAWKDLPGEVKWTGLIEAAARHRVTSLLFHAAGSRAPAELRAAAQASALRNLLRAAELGRLYNLLKAAGLRTVVLKGAGLGVSAYGNLSLREFADLDLLIAPRDVAPATAVLASAGYRPSSALAPKHIAARLRWETELTFFREDGLVEVDLHWRLTPHHFPMRLDPRRLLDSGREIEIAGHPVAIPSPELHLVFLAIHGAKHRWERLQWVCDVAWLCARVHPDGMATFDAARAANAEDAMILAAALAQVLFLYPRWQLPHCPDWIAAAMAVLDAPEPAEPSRLAEYRFQAMLTSRTPLARWRHFAGTLLTPTEADWELRRLPGYLLWLYGPLRWGKLVRKYWRRGGDSNPR